MRSITHMALSDTAEHDAIKSWLQNLELKDNKLGAARSGRARVVDITTAIGRLQEKAYVAFPHIERSAVDSFVREYIDPLNLAPTKLED